MGWEGKEREGGKGELDHRRGPRGATGGCLSTQVGLYRWYLGAGVGALHVKTCVSFSEMFCGNEKQGNSRSVGPIHCSCYFLVVVEESKTGIDQYRGSATSIHSLRETEIGQEAHACD